MIRLVERNQDHNYCIYQSDFIVNNIDYIISDCYLAHDKFKSIFPDVDSTWTYDKYNIFCLTSPSPYFYNIYKDLIFCIKDYFRYQDIDGGPFWIQSWLNFHKQEEVLDWHDHNWPFHGYMSIDPKKSKTVFHDFHIDNEIGFIYVGEGHKQHKVEVIEPYDGERITIAYDMTLTPGYNKNHSLIPVL